ncbi:sensor domain-containing diguanylate cyclase [Alkalicoccus saliphilus]|uniref:GGDEF domain-containing protein n=1 Tax=Alkalicoccus saliphilus TaxID=200989 RepID=A0A2T4U6M1_9BACI|nr:sensor domain-containing diguanylate cyclase [Alkalicoccus saliphilus]PTL39015.1 GGDEF domain-containing protein [Alkalicoccus saliphilus]
MDKKLDSAPCGYIVFTKDGHIKEVNETMCTMLSVTKIQLHKKHLHDIISKASRIYFQTYFTPLLMMHEEVKEMYLTFVTPDNVELPTLVNAYLKEEEIVCAVLQMKVRDEYEQEILVEKKNAERIMQETDKAYKQLQGLLQEFEKKRKELTLLNGELEQLSITDSLTGLYNRRYIESRLEDFLEEARNNRVPFGVLMIDIDHFKVVNDRFGHQAGDEVLKELAGVLSSGVRSDDVIGRLGGEEFLILLGSAGKEEAVETGERLCRLAADKVWKSPAVTISVGVSVYEKGDSKLDLLEKADKALYKSKAEGRNRSTCQGVL